MSMKAGMINIRDATTIYNLVDKNDCVLFITNHSEGRRMKITRTFVTISKEPDLGVLHKWESSPEIIVHGSKILKKLIDECE